jgi:CysZ protein
MSQLTRGFGDVRRGFTFLNAHPRLWGWVMAPALVTLILLGGLILIVSRMLDSIVTKLTGYLPAFLSDVAGVGLSILVVIGLGAAALLVFISLAGAIAGPFCELLSEAVEQKLTGKNSPPFSLPQFVADATKGIAHSLRRLFGSLFGAVVLLALSFVPLAGSLAALLIGGWFAARAAAYDSYDAILSRRSLSYADKIAFLENHSGRSLGLGAAVAAMLLLPGLNLVALGVGAVGATLACHELASEAQRHPERY